MFSWDRWRFYHHKLRYKNLITVGGQTQSAAACSENVHTARNCSKAFSNHSFIDQMLLTD